MKLLLTGAYGFIGKYFLEKNRQKYEITPFRFSKDAISKINYNGIDVVVHLAALVHQTDKALWQDYEEINIKRTLELAKSAKSHQVKHFIFMSTVKVYGEEREKPYSETSDCSPQDDYAKSKLIAEKELLKLEDKNFTISIIRTPIVYGFGVKANLKSLIALIRKFPIIPLGDIENKRSMVYIGNLIYLMDRVIDKKLSGVFLASDSEVLSTLELMKLISKYLDKKVFFVKIPLFSRLVEYFKPLIYKRLYKNLQINNAWTKEKLKIINPYHVEDGVRFMLKGEDDVKRKL